MNEMTAFLDNLVLGRPGSHYQVLFLIVGSWKVA